VNESMFDVLPFTLVATYTTAENLGGSSSSPAIRASLTRDRRSTEAGRPRIRRPLRDGHEESTEKSGQRRHRSLNPQHYLVSRDGNCYRFIIRF
jgi:hypothetical protein